MTILHHPDDATLMSFAAGSLPEALSAVVACHLAMCPRCRAEVAEMEALGAVLLESGPVMVMAPDTGSATAPGKLIELPPATDSRRSARHANAGNGASHGESDHGESDVPAPLARLLGVTGLDDIPWRRLGLGVWHHPIALTGNGVGDLRLLKVAPGQVMPEHGHGGSELTLLLRGSYRDEIGTFAVGDLADLDDEIEHSPIADPRTGCICIVASDAKARFKGLVARMVQPLTGM